MRNIWIAGWLLVAYQGPLIAWYETEKDCKRASAYYDSHFKMTRCVPDRFEFDEGGSLHKTENIE